MENSPRILKFIVQMDEKFYNPKKTGLLQLSGYNSNSAFYQPVPFLEQLQKGSKKSTGDKSEKCGESFEQSG